MADVVLTLRLNFGGGGVRGGGREREAMVFCSFLV